MKKLLTILTTGALFAGFCPAQQSDLPTAGKASVPDNGAPGIPSGDQPAYYASLNRRAIELKAQSDLLNQLAQEHRKRAGELSQGADSKAQWERDLAKELGDRSLAVLGLLNNLRKEQASFEQAHPDIAASVTTNSPSGALGPSNPEELAFLAKLEERLATVQQEIADAMEAGKVYTAQLSTNANSPDFSRIASLVQENGRVVRQLQKEASDLELRKLEFRALHKE